jgi:hypothetical protein
MRTALLYEKTSVNISTALRSTAYLRKSLQ